jgi:hypothetical protein
MPQNKQKTKYTKGRIAMRLWGFKPEIPGTKLLQM